MGWRTIGLAPMPDKSAYDLLPIFARFGREENLSLRDSNAVTSFLRRVEASVLGALESDSFLHGQRTQNMFEALIVSLGRYHLLKLEDAGRVHPFGTYTAPDFRVILEDGTHWLIEVKNVYEQDPSNQRFSIKLDYLAKLQQYAAEFTCPLKLALYWARWRIWTLIDPGDLTSESYKASIDMFTAIRVNELARLGDLTVGTSPPLAFRLFTDPSKPRSVSSDGQVSFTVARAAV